jgi:cell division protein FtsI/penicillin-binding protein 2
LQDPDDGFLGSFDKIRGRLIFAGAGRKMGSRTRAIVRQRSTSLMILFLLLFAALAGRLVFIQLCSADQYKEWASKIRWKTISVLTSRGTIYDRNGRPLALSIRTSSVFANTREIEDAAVAAQRVSALIGGSPTEYQKKIRSGSGIVWLAKKIDPRLGDRVRRGWKVDRGGQTRYERIPGIGVWFHYKRIYPAGTAAAQVLGFTNISGKPLAGAEWLFNDILANQDGKIRTELDPRGRVIPESPKKVLVEPRNGRDLFLTIDLNVQHIAEEALANVAKEFHPDSACAIVIEPHTGDILALANYPSFDPNDALKFPSSRWVNRAVAHLYEPGSTLKAVTVAAGLNEGIPPSVPLAKCTGRESIGKNTLRCSLHHPFDHGHGVVDMRKIIKYSCNIGAAHLAMRLGPEKLWQYEKAFGLLSKPKAGFSLEAVGYLQNPERWSLVQLANIGFGQGIAVSPLHMAGVYATIANGGLYTPPRILLGTGSRGKLINRIRRPRSRRVISAEAAAKLTEMLVDCVEDGTGKSAKIEGYLVAGKTGSAQIANPKGHGYLPDAFVASFIGFVPADKPRFTIAVIVSRPKGSHFGATVAAPAFREIAEKLLRYYHIPAQKPDGQQLYEKRRTRDKSLVHNVLTNLQERFIDCLAYDFRDGSGTEQFGVWTPEIVFRCPNSARLSANGQAPLG